MLDSFTDAAREVFVKAQVLAHERGDHPANAAHLLVALAGRPGPTSDALAAQGVTKHSFESRVPRAHGIADCAPASWQIGFSASARSGHLATRDLSRMSADVAEALKRPIGW